MVEFGVGGNADDVILGSGWGNETREGRWTLGPVAQMLIVTGKPMLGDMSLTVEIANAFVADAFSRWTSVSTAALTATRAGQLDEDVSGANIIPLPADIQPNSAKSLAIVYDADGHVLHEAERDDVAAVAGILDLLQFLEDQLRRRDEAPSAISAACAAARRGRAPS